MIEYLLKKKEKNMKKISVLILALAFFVSASTSWAAEGNTVCTTDSYGNTSCTTHTPSPSPKTEVEYVSTPRTTTQEAPILNTSTTTAIPMIAGALVALGGVSFFLKKKLK